ncbi:hypothetical protein FACS189411_12900 [Bacteroidia bacterium]|nr:hypothetical protein FACS189411_12900 [Bacteroidia bacterium]
MAHSRNLFLLFGVWFIVQTVVSQTKQIPVDILEDKIYASWLGQIIGNIYGLPHENAYIDKPGPETFPYGYGRNLERLKELNGGYSDDDTDFEYIYLMSMEKYGIEPSYAQLTEAWKYHVRDMVWLANRAALGLMHSGLTPPATGMKDYNPHWFQIDPQLINEIWAVTSPGMIDYAVAKSEWAARITNDDWGVEPTMFYGALYSAAFFENDINKLIAIGYQYLPANGRFRKAIDDMRALHKQYPDNWVEARQKLRDKYYYNEPEETQTKWNSILNGSCAVLALLYGEGDYQRTLDLACAMGFDADNQAATLSGLFGVMNGTKGLPSEWLYPIKGWTLPFNDLYKNVTRYDMPDGHIRDMAKRTASLAGKIILKNGGSLKNNIYTIQTKRSFSPPLEFTKAPIPVMNAGDNISYVLPVSGNTAKVRWELKGVLPKGLQFMNGAFAGLTTETGCFPLEISMATADVIYSQKINLKIRPANLAFSAVEVLTNVPITNHAIRDSMWYSFGRSLYATSVEVIKDGKLRGPQSVYYSILNNIPYPKVDYFGYKWEEQQSIGHIGFHIGSIEENGGWYSSLTVQYLNENGYWTNADEITIDPALSNPTDIYQQPHFIEYFISFKPVYTKAVRIIGDATLHRHWNEKSRAVSPYVSITELSVYSPFY